jgi:hypothetical protein
MKLDEVIARAAMTIRSEVAPAVMGSYQRTQAYMAAVILEKVARQLLLQTEHQRAETDEMAALWVDLELLTTPGSRLRRAVYASRSLGANAALSELLKAALSSDEPERDAVLQRTRRMMRAQLDRQLAYSE